MTPDNYTSSRGASYLNNYGYRTYDRVKCDAHRARDTKSAVTSSRWQR